MCCIKLGEVCGLELIDERLHICFVQLASLVSSDRSTIAKLIVFESIFNKFNQLPSFQKVFLKICTYFPQSLTEILAQMPLSFHHSWLFSSARVFMSSVSCTRWLPGSCCESRTAAKISIQLLSLPGSTRNGRSFTWMHMQKIFEIKIMIWS